MSKDSLEIIDKQIQKLKEKDVLDYHDTKRLEILIKMQRLILEKPTEIIKKDDDIYTDYEVLRSIKKHTKKKRTSSGRKKKTTSRTKTSS